MAQCRTHLRGNRVAPCRRDSPDQSLRVAFQVRGHVVAPAIGVARSCFAERRDFVRQPNLQSKTEGIADLLRAKEVGRMPTQDRPDRVARKSGSAGGSYRRFSSLGQAFPDDRFEVVSFHCGIDTTIPGTSRLSCLFLQGWAGVRLRPS